ncbi:WXG100 family type VII secretion target, partial [Mycobacterium sp. ITM-2017-0098]
KSSLSALQKVVDAAHRNYSDAVSKNGQMWQT